MTRIETPQQIAHSRTVTAESVLTGRADLRAYPHRHLAVMSYGTPPTLMMELMSSAEHLSQWGWELVNVASADNRVMCAVMRRHG